MKHTDKPTFKQELSFSTAVFGFVAAAIPSLAVGHDGHGQDGAAHWHAWDVGALGLFALAVGAVLVLSAWNRRK